MLSILTTAPGSRTPLATSKLQRRFLNRVRKFDSCRGHSFSAAARFSAPGGGEERPIEEAHDPSLVFPRPGGHPAGVRRLGNLPDLLRLAGGGVVLRVELLLLAPGPVQRVDQEH